MAGNRRQKKSGSFSFSSFFRGRKSSTSSSTRGEELHGGGFYGGSNTEHQGRVWPSDEDKGRFWVAEPGIDKKAKAYIDRVHKILVSETESQTVMLHPNAPAPTGNAN